MLRRFAFFVIAVLLASTIVLNCSRTDVEKDPVPRCLESTTVVAKYDSYGDVTGFDIIYTVENDGCAGYVSVSVESDDMKLGASTVFHMDEGEKVDVKATFEGSQGLNETFIWDCHPARSGNLFAGTMEVTRTHPGS